MVIVMMLVNVAEGTKCVFVVVRGLGKNSFVCLIRVSSKLFTFLIPSK